MRKAKRAIVRMNTLEEDAAIQRGIDADPDNPEITDAQMAEMRPAAEVMPKPLYSELTKRRGRPPGDKPAKVLVSVRVAPDVLARLRASGPGWLVRAEEALRKLADEGQ